MGRLSEYINGSSGTYRTTPQAHSIGGNGNVKIDTSQVDRLLNALDDEDNKRDILFNAVKDGAKVLQQQAKQSFRREIGNAATHYSKYIRKPFEDGITLKGDKAYCEAIVSIMSDFRMKFFETGTKQRKTKGRKIVGYANERQTRLKREGKGHDTGAITATYFFRNARTQSETAINEAMKQSIDNALKKLIPE